MTFLKTFVPRAPALLFWLTCAFSGGASWAQQDTADRLWQGTEQQLRQSRQQANPESQQNLRGGAYEAALRALTQTPRSQLEKLTFAILAAVNQGDWFGADRLLRQYAKVPQHDPALADFVVASRLASEGDYAAAIENYRKVLQSNPLFVRADLDLARVLYADNRLRDAQEIFDRLHAQHLSTEIDRHIGEYQSALEQRRRPQLSLTLGLAREDNLNNASTFIDACALRFVGACLQNNPGKEIADTGIYFEASLNKLWPLAGNHGVLLRSLNFGNHYRHEDRYDNLVSSTYLGYQYHAARNQFQLLPLFEYDREGRHTAYHAIGFRTSFSRQLGQRARVEASYEYKNRDFASRFSHLQGDSRSAGLFGSYVLRPDLLLYGNLIWRDNAARMRIYSYREKIARIGLYKSFANQVTVNVAYGYRQRQAEETYFLFGRRQRDHENSLYLNVTLPRYAWQGFTPTLTYERRDNRSTVPHAYNYVKNRFMLGFNKVF